MSSPSRQIAVLGTGLMGAPIAQKLKKAGHMVTVYNRTLTKAEPLREWGITVAHSPQEAIEKVEGVITMLSDARATREVLLDPEIRRTLRGKTVLQMGTIGSEESRELQMAVQTVGGFYLEAPVLGSRVQVDAGTLFVLVGGSKDDLEKWIEVLRVLGEIHHAGGVGQAATLKLALNHLIAALTTAFSLSVSMVKRSGVEVDVFMEILRESALYAPTYDKKLRRILDDDFTDPNFPVKWMLKDVDLILQEAGSLGLQVDALEGIRTLFKSAIDSGWGEMDYSAVFRSVNSPSVS